MKVFHLPIFRTPMAVLLTTGFLAACGGGSGEGLTPPPSTTPQFAANFSEIQTNIFTPTCAVAGCHTGAGAPQGLRLDEANSFALLVAVASSEAPAIQRVAPGDPDNSYLIQKLEGTASSGAQMPFGRTPLAQSTIDIVRQWITDGAIDDRVQAIDPIRVTSLDPMPGATLDVGPLRILAGFDREVDASTVHAMTFKVVGSGGDGTFGDGNEIPIMATAISAPAANTQSAVFDMGGSPLPDEWYQVSLLGAGSPVIMDLDGNALDGEFGGAFPSGDGAQGGDFVAEFTVQAPVSMGQTLDEIQATVFSVSCAGCHTGPTGNTLPAGMDLSSADASFASLVGNASLQQPAVLRVATGDSDDSYLIQKLEGTAASGARMPFGNPPLDPAVIAGIRQWIDNGAMR